MSENREIIKMFNNMEEYDIMVQIPINNEIWYEIDLEDRKMKRFKKTKNSLAKYKETGDEHTIEELDTFDFYFDMNIYDNTKNFEQLCEVTIYKSYEEEGDNENRTFYIRESENLSKLIDYIQVANCYIDNTNRDLKNELISVFNMIKSLKSKYGMVEKLKTNGWDLSTRKYIRNKMSLFKSKQNENVDKWKESVLYLLENEECVSLLTTFKILNFTPYNSYPYAVNVFGTHDTGKTTSDLISQSFFNKPESFTFISEAGLEEYRRRSKNYFLSFEETQLQGDKKSSELVYGLANGSRRQTMKSSRRGWDLDTNLNESNMLLTLIGEKEYISPSNGGDKDRLYKYNKLKPEFETEEERIEYRRHIKRFHLYKDDNYGIFFEDLIEFLEGKAKEIEEIIPELGGKGRRGEFVEFFKYVYGLSKEFFKTYYNVDMYDISNVIDTFLDENEKTDNERELDVILQLESLIRGYDNKYIEFKEGYSTALNKVGFVNSPNGNRTLYLYLTKSKLKGFFNHFNVDEVVMKKLFDKDFKKTTTTFNEVKEDYVMSIKEETIKDMKKEVLSKISKKDMEEWMKKNNITEEDINEAGF